MPSTIKTLIGGTTFASPDADILPVGFAGIEGAASLFSTLLLLRKFRLLGDPLSPSPRKTGEASFRVSSLALLATGDRAVGLGV